MITLPLPLKYKTDVITTNVTITTLVTEFPQGARESRVKSPNASSGTVKLTYPQLTHAEANTVETALLGTKGTERILLDAKHYVIDGYEVSYTNATATINFTLMQVG